MILNKRTVTCVFMYLWAIVSGFSLYLDVVNKGTDEDTSTQEYSAIEIEIPLHWLNRERTESNEISSVAESTVNPAKDTELDAIAETMKVEATNSARMSGQVYDVPINTAPDIKSGQVLEGEYITIDIDKLMVYVDAEYDSYEWDTKKRIKDIYILKEILVNQLGMAPSKAAAVIGNVCCEDSFAGLTNSVANLDNLSHAKSVLGNGGRGYGCVQWTSAYRQLGLQDYYEVIDADLDWELTSIIAETAYMYNELYVSGIIGDLTEDDDLEHLTGIIGCVYEAYGKSTEEWYMSNGRYKTNGCQRYTYAKNIYDLIVSEGE